MKKPISIILILLLIFSMPMPAFAGQKATLRTKVFAFFVKTFAKAYVATVNLTKFKEKNIRKVRKMDEAKFQKIYMKIYEEIKDDLPADIKESYGVTPHMTREMAVERINALTKKRMIKLIKAIPDELVLKQYRLHRNEIKEPGLKSLEDKQVDEFWNDMLEDTIPASQS